MTVPVSGSTDITRADVAATFKTQITDVVNAISKWRAESNPGGANLYLIVQDLTHSFVPVEGTQTVTVANPILAINSIQALTSDGVSEFLTIDATGISILGNQVTFTLTFNPPYTTFVGNGTISYKRVTTSAVAGTPIIESTTPAPLTGALLAGNTVSSSPVAGDIAFGNLSLGAVATLLQNTAIVLSRARLVRLIKQYRSTLGGYVPMVTAYDTTNHAHLTAAYQLSSTGVTSPSVGDVDASVFNTFVTNLQSAVTSHRNTLVTFTETWCHSSCHSSHSSRSRR